MTQDKSVTRDSDDTHLLDNGLREILMRYAVRRVAHVFRVVVGEMRVNAHQYILL